MDATTLLVVVGVGALVLYVLAAFRWPRQRCKRCSASSGRDFGPGLLGKRAYRRCRKCNGKGWYTRPLRRVFGGRLEDDDMAYPGA